MLIPSLKLQCKVFREQMEANGSELAQYCQYSSLSLVHVDALTKKV